MLEEAALVVGPFLFQRRNGALPVSRKNVLVSFRMRAFKPRKQRWPKVETDLRVVVRDRIRRVTLVVNAFVPIVVRRGAYLALDSTCPGIFAWRLIKMAVNY